MKIAIQRKIGLIPHSGWEVLETHVLASTMDYPGHIYRRVEGKRPVPGTVLPELRRSVIFVQGEKP